MSARRAVLVLALAASAGIAAYAAYRREQNAAQGGPFSGDASVLFEYPGQSTDFLSSWGQGGDEYDTSGAGGALDSFVDGFLPVAYRIENIFSTATGERMNLSLAGLHHIKQFEGYSATPYKDVAGKWTIGYGHLLRAGEWWDSITEDFALSLLAQDVGDAEDAVNSLVKVSLTQPQYDALVSFVYNVGAGAFRRSTLLRKLNAGDYAGAALELPKWRMAGGRVVQGLVNRRMAEVSLFQAGGYA